MSLDGLLAHWQWLTGTTGLIAFLALLWRYGIRAARCEKRASECVEDLAIIQHSLKLAREELAYFNDSVRGWASTTRSKRRTPPSDEK